MRLRNRILIAAVPACLTVALAARSLPVRAEAVDAVGAQPQPLAGKPEAQAGEILTRQVPVLNLPAPTFAFLLDPQHQPEPLMFSTSRLNSAALASAGPSPSELFAVPTLAPGVSIVEASDLHNALTLRGEAGALDAWQKAIETLDKPLRQVEVELQMVRLAPAALKELGAATDVPGPQLLRGNFIENLRRLLVNGQAKVLTAPRVTAVSGLTASLSSTTMAPLPVPGNKNWAVPLPERIFVGQGVGMAVRPTLRPDDLIDLEMAAGFSWLAQAEGGAPVPLRPAQRFSLRLRDGDSGLVYANPNFAPPAAEPLQAAPSSASGAQPDAEGKVAIFLVTAHIVRRSPVEEGGAPIKVQDVMSPDFAEAVRSGR